jgi:hypothetical protein
MRAQSPISLDTFIDPSGMLTPAPPEIKSVWNAIFSTSKLIKNYNPKTKHLTGSRSLATTLWATVSARRLSENN